MKTDLCWSAAEIVNWEGVSDRKNYVDVVAFETLVVVTLVVVTSWGNFISCTFICCTFG